MSGLFGGLELGKRALMTNQLWLNTIGHNIANVNTPGYSRQRVLTTTSDPFNHPIGPVGTGVKAVNINHIRDLFLNQQYIFRPHLMIFYKFELLVYYQTALSRLHLRWHLKLKLGFVIN